MTIELDAQITDVTVYPYRARVTRSGRVDLEAGESILVLPGLTAFLAPDSVRVSGTGAGITIRGVDVKSDVQEESRSTENLRKEYKAKQEQAKALENDMEVIENQLDFYRAIKTQATEESGIALLKAETSLERVTQIADFVREQMKKTLAECRELEKQQEDLKKETAAIFHQLEGAEIDEIKRGLSIYIAIEAVEDASFNYEIVYVVTNAEWQSIYDLRLKQDDSVELTYLAQVWQSTGEDWAEVNLSLSTARPATASSLPEPATWYVNSGSRPAADSGVRRRKVGSADKKALTALASRLADTETPDLPAPKAQIQQAEVASSTSGAVVNYKVGMPVTLAGGGQPHKTTVTIASLHADLDYLVAPRVAQEAYLRATITNTSEYTLLPGEASIFHDNDFVGKTRLKTIAPTEEFEVQLGVDDRIKVERELVKRDSVTRFIGNVAKTEYRYELRLRNLTDKVAKISVKEPYPLPSDTEIKVKLDKVSPKPQEESELHLLTWELELAAGGKQTIELAFTIERGRNDPVYGLDD